LNNIQQFHIDLLQTAISKVRPRNVHEVEVLQFPESRWREFLAGAFTVPTHSLNPLFLGKHPCAILSTPGPSETQFITALQGWGDGYIRIFEEFSQQAISPGSYLDLLLKQTHPLTRTLVIPESKETCVVLASLFSTPHPDVLLALHHVHQMEAAYDPFDL
jgi:hypothetical protein